MKDPYWKLSIYLALGHCIIGNILVQFADNVVLDVLFLPYSFIAGLSAIAGWGISSLLFESIGLLVMVLVFYPFSLLLYRNTTGK